MQPVVLELLQQNCLAAGEICRTRPTSTTAGLLQETSHADIRIQVNGGEYVDAHRVVLCARSCKWCSLDATQMLCGRNVSELTPQFTHITLCSIHEKENN
jgi:hypothetical protein